MERSIAGNSYSDPALWYLSKRCILAIRGKDDKVYLGHILGY